MIFLKNIHRAEVYPGITPASLGGTRLLENAFPEKNNFKNSIYNKLSFLSLFSFEAELFISINKKVPDRGSTVT